MPEKNNSQDIRGGLSITYVSVCGRQGFEAAQLFSISRGETLFVMLEICCWAVVVLVCRRGLSGVGSDFRVCSYVENRRGDVDDRVNSAKKVRCRFPCSLSARSLFDLISSLVHITSFGSSSCSLCCASSLPETMEGGRERRANPPLSPLLIQFSCQQRGQRPSDSV